VGVIVDWPLATRDEIVAAFKLGAEIASDTPFKTLRHKGIVSRGVRVLPRKSGRLAGQKVFYSSLCLHAARLARHGRLDAARHVAVAAAELEQMPEAQVLAQAAVDGKLTEAVLARLAAATSDTVSSFEDDLAEIASVTAGRVVGLDEETVTVAAEGARWCLLRRTLPPDLAVPGAPLVVITEWLGAAGALVTARAGVLVTDEDRFRPRRPPAPVLLPSGNSSDPRRAIATALGSMRAEGLVPSTETANEASRLASGEIGLEEFVSRVLRRYGAAQSH